MHSYTIILLADSTNSISFIIFQNANPLGEFFFMAFVGVVIFGLMSMFVTIICEAMAIVKEDAEGQQNDYEVCELTCI